MLTVYLLALHQLVVDSLSFSASLERKVFGDFVKVVETKSSRSTKYRRFKTLSILTCVMCAKMMLSNDINDDMTDYVTKMKAKLDSVLIQLEWDLETLRKPLTSVCKNQNGKKLHVPSSSLLRHELMCALIKQGLSRKEAQKIYETSCHPEFYPDDLKMELSEVDKVNISAGQRDFDSHASVSEILASRTGRLAVYESMVEKAKASQKLQKLDISKVLLMEDQNEDDKMSDKSDVESLVAQRDNKRRRQTYRAKNVHITKKTYTEVMRDVISNQMEMLEKHNDTNQPTAESDSVHGHEKIGDTQGKIHSANQHFPKYECDNSPKHSRNDVIDYSSSDSSRSQDHSQMKKSRYESKKY